MCSFNISHWSTGIFLFILHKNMPFHIVNSMLPIPTELHYSLKFDSSFQQTLPNFNYIKVWLEWILSLDALDFNVSEIGCNYTQTIPSFDTQVQILSNVAKIFVVLHSYFLWNSPVNQYSYDYKIWNSFVNTKV